MGMTQNLPLLRLLRLPNTEPTNAVPVAKIDIVQEIVSVLSASGQVAVDQRARTKSCKENIEPTELKRHR